MLPFFLIVWASISFVHNYYSRLITLGATVKSCAWLYSNLACDRSHMPAECATFMVNDAADFSSSDLHNGGAFEQFASNALVAPIIRLVLGSNAYVNGSGSVARGAQLGSGNTAIAARAVIMCNEVPVTPAELARSAFCNLSHFCH